MAELLFKPCNGADSYIFVSYSHKDKEKVFRLLNLIHKFNRGKGMKCRIWVDEGGIPWGEVWKEYIRERIDWAEVCLVFWSEGSAVSKYCREEIERMKAKEKKIRLVRLDDTPVKEGEKWENRKKWKKWKEAIKYLRKFEDIKAPNCANDAALVKFAKIINQNDAFIPCKIDPYPERELQLRAFGLWHKAGNIQWCLDGNDVLTIAKNEMNDKNKENKKHKKRKSWTPVPMPDYKWDKGDTAPWYGKKIQYVVIEKNIDRIGSYAFLNCSDLKKVILKVKTPDRVISLGECAFKGCSSLTGVEIIHS